MKKYYYKVFVSCRSSSGMHIIKALSKKDALRIREKYGISNPRFATEINRISISKMDEKDAQCKFVIERRKRGFGGSIWCEKDGQLQIEGHDKERKITV